MRRLGVASLLACAAVAGTPAAAGADYSTGDYKGETSQGRPMILTVAPGKVVRYGFSVEVTCRKGSKRRREGGKYTNRMGIPIGGDGSFRSNRGRGSYKPNVNGRVEGNQASGTFKFAFKKNGWSCKAPTVSWNAELLGSGPPQAEPSERHSARS